MIKQLNIMFECFLIENVAEQGIPGLRGSTTGILYKVMLFSQNFFEIRTSNSVLFTVKLYYDTKIPYILKKYFI